MNRRQVRKLVAALVTGLTAAISVGLFTGTYEKVALVLIAVAGALYHVKPDTPPAE